MPRNTRQWARRELENSRKGIDWAGTHVHRVAELYRALHPEIANPLDECLSALMAVDETLLSIRASI